MLTENEKWLISFYRQSEITGALFFGRLAQYIPDAKIKKDLTKHFADESAHAWYWTECLDMLGLKSVRTHESYQDKYLDVTGVPTNTMEILSITQIFEKRVIGQYQRHLQLKDINPIVKNTLSKIMIDEAWHVKWIADALKGFEKDYGVETVEKTLERFKKADEEVYEQYCKEHDERLGFILSREK